MVLPFENDTSKVIKRLSKRSLEADKRRNLFIIITIAFAVCLMVVLSLFTFGKSHELKTFLQGRYQAAVINTDINTIFALSKDENFEMVGTEVKVRDFRIDDFTFYVNYRDENDLRLRSIDLKGRLPQNENEVAVSSAFLKHAGLAEAVGQRISLPLNDAEAEYIVCGIINDDGSSRNYEVLVSAPFLQSRYTGNIPYVAILRVWGSEGFKPEELKEIIRSCLGSYGIGETDIAYSSSYFQTVDNLSRDVTVIFAVSLLIVVACGVVIYSLFYISVVGKTREYGRFRVIGMTQTQVKRMVRGESRRLSLLSIPIGTVVGCIIGYALVPKGWYWPNTLMCVIGVAVLTEIAVKLSVRKPVKIAASVSPIEAIRITTTASAMSQRETKKLTRKLSPHNLARINFSRNRKKVSLTLLSLGFTGILLVCAASYLNSVDAVSMARQAFRDKEIAVSLSPNFEESQETTYVNVYSQLQRQNPLDDDLISELLENPLITDVETIKSSIANIFLPGNSNVDGTPYFELAGLSEQELAKFSSCLIDGEMDYGKLVNERGILVDDTNGMIERFGHYKVKLGDKVTIETDTGEMLEFIIMGTVNLNDSPYKGLYFFMPQELLQTVKKSITNFNSELMIQTDIEKLPEAEQMIFDRLGNNQDLKIESFYDVLAFLEFHLKAERTPLYGLVFFIAVFGLLNLINTLMTNLVSRRQEFGILQSIGLSGQQLTKMLWIECLYYMLGTMAITLTAGTAAGYVLCMVFDEIGLFGKVNYTFPILQISIFFAALILVAVVYSALAACYCRKQVLVESIKTME